MFHAANWHVKKDKSSWVCQIFPSNFTHNKNGTVPPALEDSRNTSVWEKTLNFFYKNDNLPLSGYIIINGIVSRLPLQSLNTSSGHSNIETEKKLPQHEVSDTTSTYDISRNEGAKLYFDKVRVVLVSIMRGQGTCTGTTIDLLPPGTKTSCTERTMIIALAQ